MKRDIPALTGLRGLAALLVLFFHIRTLDNHQILPLGWADPIARFGYLGVDVFFILSGYLLAYIYWHKFADGITGKDCRAFFGARFARIYPLHFATTFLMLGVFYVGLRLGVRPELDGGYTPKAVALTLLLVQEWFHVPAPDSASWSISVELASYLAFPLYVWLLSRAPRWWPVLVFIALPPFLYEVADWRLMRGMGEFLGGCAIFGLQANYAISYNRGPVKWAGKLLAIAPVVFIGEISYSIYLLQWPVWAAWKHLGPRFVILAVNPHLLVSLATLSVLGVSTASYYLFEKPAREWLKLVAKRTSAGSRTNRRAEDRNFARAIAPDTSPSSPEYADPV